MVGGIDTHADLHQAAVIDSIGRHLATQQFETTPDGSRLLGLAVSAPSSDGSSPPACAWISPWTP
ncbi:IS110 family transposase [Streptomyces bingchenggensis BCW-1]|uniref:IS110 family transposase n=1 Tax=Streptomyces bingchenggensis (strain BCW-1) TaxID=749414 RepID=D7CBK5_STRBB|nr:IS110 family transposase [Streptomyces bingchenggensis BCW-1]